MCRSLPSRVSINVAVRYKSTSWRKDGVAVFIQAKHLCTQGRSVRDLSLRARTIVTRGACTNNSLVSEEFRLLVDRRTATPATTA
jgi:GTP cyclohydrolase I